MFTKEFRALNLCRYQNIVTKLSLILAFSNSLCLFSSLLILLVFQSKCLLFKEHQISNHLNWRKLRIRTSFVYIMTGCSDLFQINSQDLTENVKMLPMLRTVVNLILITPQIHSSECFLFEIEREKCKQMKTWLKTKK